MVLQWSRQSVRVSEVAWALDRLVRIGMVCRTRSYCLGLVKPTEIVCEPQALRRQTIATCVARLRVMRHLRAGHDESCAALGTPRTTIEGFLRYWATPDAADFLIDRVTETVNEVVGLEQWSLETVGELWQYHLGARITQKRPRIL